MVRRLALALAAAVGVAVPVLLATPAHAGCLSVAGAGVCENGYIPSPTLGEDPVHSPTQICYLVDCIEQGEEIGTVPTVDVEGGRLICVHVDYTCVVPVDVPDI